MPKTTAIPQPKQMRSQSESEVMPSPRPDSGSAITYIATTPVPKAIRTKVPRNSDRYSPTGVARQPVLPGGTPARASATSSPFR